MEGNLHTRYREMLRLAADAQRWRILQLLGERALTVSELVELMDIEQPAVSHHLGRLRGAGLVTSRIEGRSRRYSWTRPDPGSDAGEVARLLRRLLGNGGAREPVATSPAACPPIEIHLL